MEPLTLALWAIRLAFLAALYVFLALVVRALLRDVRAASRDPSGALGRLVVIASASLPAAGSVFPLDAVTTLGRDLGCGVVLEDPFASSRHAILTFRGRGWYVEDLGSTNGTLVNGVTVAGGTPLGFGDEIRIGEIRMRLERGLG
ncbi:MAG TPA: FHA domain-containing protein [Candidatus Limnocylindrales bacterium]